MPNYNFLSNIGRAPQGGDIIDSLGRGFTLGRSIGSIPYQNALQAAQMEELENKRRATEEYANTLDPAALARYKPLETAQLMQSEEKLNTAEALPKLKVLYTMGQGLMKPETYDQTRADIINMFPSFKKVIAPTWTPETPALVADRLSKIGTLIKSGEKKLLKVGPGDAIYDTTKGEQVFQNPLQARPLSPYEAGRLGQYQQGLDIQREGQKTIVPGEIDTETGLPKTPTETFTGKVKFRPGAGARTTTAVPVMTESQAKAAGTVPQGTRIIKDNDPDYAAAWQQAVTLVASVVTQMSEEEKVASTQRIANDLYQRRKAGRPGATGTPAPIAPAGSVNIRPTSTPPAAMLREGAKRAVLNPSSGETEYWTLKNGQAVRVE